MTLPFSNAAVIWGAFLVALSATASHLCADEASLLTVSQPHMGTIVRIVADCEDAQLFQKATDEAFARIREIEQICSDYRSDSEVLLLSAKSPTSEPISVSDDLWNVLNQAHAVNRASHGAFDVTVGPLTKEWRRFRRRGQLDPMRIEEVRTSVGAQHMTLDEKQHAVSLAVGDMRIDLGGIAKGYAIDGAIEVLTKHGITRALVDAGGDIAVTGAPRGEPGWRVGIAGLDPKQPPILVAYLSGCAVATSGDAFQFLEHDGKRYSHILDPRTGYGVDHRATVTVFAKTATEADAWASAICVLGPVQTPKVLKQEPGIAAWMEVLVDEKPITWASKNLGTWLSEHSQKK
ncbi:Thiamine biosynthesis lipoprotein ApbE precursor [Bremerella volcania]|uniref:FAD:protein FMN transferase n=1 Tax=Bremerella volcania TaxID=2527984 RepID=A0A518CAQ6_9BACT|nr:FAD:protein FMN transferase [Bremerella volcania]QDU76315.1 Thiamine biosynthesis lipoprotein ApbE precursor [Bremerella volcania]